MHHVRYTVGRPLYEIAVEGEEPAVASAEALLEEWGESIPDLAARVLDLAFDESVIVSHNPMVIVRRIR